RSDATELAVQAVGTALTPGQVSRYWLGQSLHFIWREPGAWLRLTGRKTLMMIGVDEIVDSEDVVTDGDASFVLRWSSAVCHFGVLIPLAVVGVWVTWPQRSRLWWLYGLAIGYFVSIVLFYVVGRYRYPMAPLLILLASAGLVGAPRAWRDRSGWS